MTPDEAGRLAERTLAAVDNDERESVGPSDPPAYFRERIASDLAGVRRHADSYSHPSGRRVCTQDGEWWPCDDARHYSDSLRRTAALYGVEP